MTSKSRLGELLEKEVVSFQAEGRLLQELGLRLVARPEVALVELIKNAYDADSPNCLVAIEENGGALKVSDAGVGMTVEEFKSKWMRIATSSKLGSTHSPKYKRSLTGAKGIGRFAARFLGDDLTLVSYAHDKKYDCVTRLETRFDWRKLDQIKDLTETSVTYSLTRTPPGTGTGTQLTIRNLRNAANFAAVTESKALRDQVLRIVSPLAALTGHRKQRKSSPKGRDPGFTVKLPGEQQPSEDLAAHVLKNHWGRLTISLAQKTLKYQVWLPGFRQPKILKIGRYDSLISHGLSADIRFFPRRKGVFAGKDITGKTAWAWVRANCGVKVVDHGFHVRPYGFEDDDWLSLDRDKAHSARVWRSKLASSHFPITPAQKADAKANPVIFLPYNLQLVGAVFIETQRNPGGADEVDLFPAMDREGLLENAAFEELVEIVRGGVEFLASEDKAELDRRAEIEAKASAANARSEIEKAIRYVSSISTLAPTDKLQLVRRYQELAQTIEQQEEYSAQSRRGLMTMGLLGVVAGFMTHESKAIVHDLEMSLALLKELGKKEPAVAELSQSIETRLSSFRSYLEYSKLFVGRVREMKDVSLSAIGQVRHVQRQFETFTARRAILVETDIEDGVMTPMIPVTVYSGVILNLFTNAIKALLAQRTTAAKSRVVRIAAHNEKGRHFLEVSDNGVGIPTELRSKIWDPLFTTTSDVGNPLGSGMGLGLTLVKQVLAEFGGTIALVEPPPGFSTCFQVTLRFKDKHENSRV